MIKLNLNIKKILLLLKNSLYLFLPLIYIFYILYIRLILVRDDRILDTPLSIKQICCIIIILCVLFWRSFYLLKKIKILSTTEPTNYIIRYIQNKLNKLSTIISDIWLNFYSYVTKNAWSLNLLIIIFMRRCLYTKKISVALRIILLFEILPKMIVVIVFLIDILYFHKLHYFYTSLILLLLPLGYKLLQFMLLRGYTEMIDRLESILNISEVIREDNSIGLKYELKEGVVLEKPFRNLEDYLYNYHKPIAFIPVLLAQCERQMYKYKLYTLLFIIIILHIIGWLLILYFGIFI